VISACEEVDTGQAGERGGLIQVLRRGESVVRPGTEQDRHSDRGKVFVAPAFRFAGRVEGIGEQDEAGDRYALRDDLGGDAAAHGPATCECAPRSKLIDRGAPRVFEDGRAVGRAPAGLLVRELEPHSVDTTCGEIAAKEAAKGIVEVGAGAGSVEKYDVACRLRLAGDRRD
jgi:hypothetical protein